MIGKSSKHIFLRRILPAILAASMVVGYVEFRNFRSTAAEASTSLPGIENIKSSLLLADGSFNILEIVPDGQTGTFGYYIDGQEPDDFKDQIKSRTDDSKDEREKWARQHLRSLADKGIIDNHDNASPLYADTNNGETLYKEYYPWENVTGDFDTLHLDKEGKAEVRGTARRQEGGDFRLLSNAYEIVDQGQGSFVQNISADNPLDSLKSLFGSGKEGEDNFAKTKDQYVFYKVNADTDLASETKQDHHYNPDDHDLTDLIYRIDKNDGVVFDYAATVDREFKYGEDYYSIKQFSAKPVYGKDLNGTMDSLAKEGYLAARLDEVTPYIEQAGGFFNEDVSQLQYVGNGQGNYTIDFTGNNTITVTYSDIRYKGGYQNNNWFLKYVLDYDETDDIASVSEKIKVDVVSAGEVPDDLSNYGLVVISGGFDNDGAKVDVASIKTKIQNYIAAKGAVMFDTSATGDSDEALEAFGVSGEKVRNTNYSHGLVDKSVYVFKEDNARKNIITPYFKAAFGEDYSREDSAFYEVYKSISDENFRRKASGSVKALSTDISMVSCIRYIINYGYQSDRSAKTSIRILDIEPGDQSEIVKKPEREFKLPEMVRSLKDEYLKKWFGGQYDASQVTVTVMSTHTLAGKIEDITENYDMVYIGKGVDTKDELKEIENNPIKGLDNKDSQARLKTVQKENVKRDGALNDPKDTDMKGLVYYNIGDQITLDNEKTHTGYERAVTAGMMEKDFTEAPRFQQTYRLSGNDLTKRKYNELDTFIKSGHPVIVADDLIKDGYTKDFNIDVSLSNLRDNAAQEAYKNGTISVNTVLSDESKKDILSFDYQWYNGNGKAIPGATGASYTVPQSKKTEDGTEYYCMLTSVNAGGKKYEVPASAKVTSDTFYVGSNGNGNWARVDPYYPRSYGKKYSVSITGYAYNQANYATIDHYTKLSSLINENSSAENLFRSSDAEKNSKKLMDYINMSTPEIEFEKTADACPKAYSENTYKDDYLTDTLKMSFRIVNKTDPTPLNTTYTAKVYFDQNGDGLFTDEESAQDLFVASSDDSANQAETMKGGLTFDEATPYSLAVILPDEMAGAVNWKLVVTQNAADGQNSKYMPHASFNEISYKKKLNSDGSISNDQETIVVLQVNSNTHETKERIDGKEVSVNHPDYYNLEKSQRAAAEGTKDDTMVSNYGTLLKDGRVTDRYKIVIVTILASDFDKMLYPADRAWSKDQQELRDAGELHTDKYKLSNGKDADINLDDYDMIILGFGDTYGKLSRDSCYRILNFADEGKSVLFTHDNSLFDYIPTTDVDGFEVNSNYYFTKYNDKDKPGNGSYVSLSFNFNTVLRSIDQMDVYGITDTRNGFGGVSQWQVKDDKGNNINTGFLAKEEQLTDAQISALQGAGYSVAYKPKSNPTNYELNKVTTVPEVQGYSDNLIYRYMNNDADGSNAADKDRVTQLTTRQVGQVNRGTITTYPFDLNREDGKMNQMEVSWTHGQYNQLNMNSDDIVVWYALEKDANVERTDAIKNTDCVNNYYLFSCGNIFYTGAGHWLGPSKEEAKLFINTMIAAYRQTDAKPRAQFVASSKSTRKISSYLINAGDEVIYPIDALRQNIETVTGLDTSETSDDELKSMTCKAVEDKYGITEEDMNVIAISATTDMAKLYVYGKDNDDHNSINEAMGRASSLTTGKAVVNGNLINLNGDCTIAQVCAGIARTVTGFDDDTKAQQNARVNRGSYNNAHVFFTIKDNNNSTDKKLSAKFFLYSKTARDGYTGDNDNGYYKQIPDSEMNQVIIGDSKTNTTTSASDLKSNIIYSMELPASVKEQLQNEGVATLVIEPTVTLGKDKNGKDKTYTGNREKLQLQRVGLLDIG